jgi:hypothetical protein
MFGNVFLGQFGILISKSAILKIAILKSAI